MDLGLSDNRRSVIESQLRPTAVRHTRGAEWILDSFDNEFRKSMPHKINKSITGDLPGDYPRDAKRTPGIRMNPVRKILRLFQ